MKTSFILIFLFTFNLCTAQLQSSVVDSKTKKGIPYVNIWIENENIGTTSDELGKFNLETDNSKTIVFSAIGYETKKVLSSSIKSYVELSPLIIELDEVVINPKQPESLIIGGFKKSKIDFYFACGNVPWVSARYFEYKENYNETPYLKTIKILTKSDVNNATFNIRLYSVDENGKPQSYIYNRNIIGYAKKRKKITQVDVSKLHIKFPRNGLFIAIEWLIINQNKHEYEYTMEGSDKKFKDISYEPKIGVMPSETNKNSWVYSRGKWTKVHKNTRSTLRRYQYKYNVLAMELTLTN